MVRELGYAEYQGLVGGRLEDAGWTFDFAEGRLASIDWSGSTLFLSQFESMFSAASELFRRLSCESGDRGFQVGLLSPRLGPVLSSEDPSYGFLINDFSATGLKNALCKPRVQGNVLSSFQARADALFALPSSSRWSAVADRNTELLVVKVDNNIAPTIDPRTSKALGLFSSSRELYEYLRGVWSGVGGIPETTLTLSRRLAQSAFGASES